MSWSNLGRRSRSAVVDQYANCSSSWSSRASKTGRDSAEPLRRSCANRVSKSFSWTINAFARPAKLRFSLRCAVIAPCPDARNVPGEDQDDQGRHERNREEQRMSATLRACTGHDYRNLVRTVFLLVVEDIQFEYLRHTLGQRVLVIDPPLDLIEWTRHAVN